MRGAAANVGSRHANTLGQTTYVLLAVIAAALAIGQLELETAMLTVAVGVVITAAGLAAALAFGLGSRDVAAGYARKRRGLRAEPVAAARCRVRRPAPTGARRGRFRRS